MIQSRVAVQYLSHRRRRCRRSSRGRRIRDRRRNVGQRLGQYEIHGARRLVSTGEQIVDGERFDADCGRCTGAGLSQRAGFDCSADQVRHASGAHQPRRALGLRNRAQLFFVAAREAAPQLGFPLIVLVCRKSLVCPQQIAQQIGSVAVVSRVEEAPQFNFRQGNGLSIRGHRRQSQ